MVNGGRATYMANLELSWLCTWTASKCLAQRAVGHLPGSYSETEKAHWPWMTQNVLIPILGCKHEVDHDAKAPDGTPVTRIEYNMQPFLESCLTAYEGLVGDVKYDEVYTPFVKEDDYEHVSKAPASAGEGLICPWCEGAVPYGTFYQIPGQDLQTRTLWVL